MKPHVIRLQPHVTATGLWCDDCALPSRIRLALLDIDTLGVLSRFVLCDECGRQETLR